MTITTLNSFSANHFSTLSGTERQVIRLQTVALLQKHCLLGETNLSCFDRNERNLFEEIHYANLHSN